jgi:hypothetical protein
VKIPLKSVHESINKRIQFSFPFRINFKNIFPFQAIYQFCQDIFGNIDFEAYLNPKGKIC